MIFTLEALEAKHGDALLLHYGNTDPPKLIVIDGGPKGVYSERLQPRLEDLRAQRSDREEDPLKIRLMMVSHIDEDHIQGILELTGEMIQCDEDGIERPYSISTMWHNSFDDLVKKVKTAGFEETAGSLKTVATGGELAAHLREAVRPDTRLVLASVIQGRQLRANADKLGIPLNSGLGDLILAPESGTLRRDIGSGLTFSIIGPRQDELDALQNKWAAEIAAKKKKGTLKPADLTEAAAAAFVDKSVYNLSSIVVLAEAAGKRMLLTGDARGDYILEGLDAAGLKDPGDTLHVDLLKMPHHGSIHNVADKFFAEITADHYVISANGRDDNPDLETIEMLVESRGNTEYTIHLTNHVKWVDKFLATSKPPKVEVVYGVDHAEFPSLRVHLGDSEFNS